MSKKELQHTAKYMKAFSNPLRLEIIQLLKDTKLSVNQITERVGASQCYVSQQLSYLANKGILDRKQVHHHVYYSLKQKHVVNMLEMVRISI